MRHLVLLIGVAFAAGCQTNRPMTSSAPHFRVESTIEPGSEAETFVVTSRVYELRGGAWETLTAPRLTIRSGQSASLIVSGDRKIRVDATATADSERANGSVKVDVSDDNHSIYGSEQKLTLATPRG